MKKYFGQVTLSQERGNKNSHSTKKNENKKEKNSRDKKEYPSILPATLPYWKCQKNFAHKNESLVAIIHLKYGNFFPFISLVDNALIKFQLPKYNQQDATLPSLFISVNCSICFGWFLHPSSGAQSCTYSIWYLSNRYCHLLLSWKSWKSFNSSTIAAGSSNGMTNTSCRYSFVLLMMSGGTTRNM